MLKERIKEIFEFTKSESPYTKANKGWINQDIFLDLNPSTDTFAQGNETAKVTVFWAPINTLLSNIFIIIIISSILVFASTSLARGRFNFNLLNTSLINDAVIVEDKKDLKTTQLKDLDPINSEKEKNLEIIELDKTNNLNSLDDNQINSDQRINTPKIDKAESLIKDKKTNIGIKVLENNKSKSNFI